MELPSRLPGLKMPGELSGLTPRGEESNKRRRRGDPDGMPTTPGFFPTNPDKLNRANAILDDTPYDIPVIMNNGKKTCLVSIVTHLHGQIPIRICKTRQGRVSDANIIVKSIPHGKLSTRLMAPAGLTHLEHHEGNDECPDYNSSLRIIYISRMRMFSNLQCLPEVHFSETENVKFLPNSYYNADKSGYSEKGFADLKNFPEFEEYIHNPHYCQYFSEKNEYVEKVFTSKPLKTDEAESGLFGIYIDVAIIEQKDETTSKVTVKTFILSNKSEDFSLTSRGYIEELLVGGDPKIKRELEEFIEIGICKLSTIIEAVSFYTREKGDTQIYLTDLACSVYTTFNDSPRNYTKFEKPSLDLIALDEINKERTDKLFDDKNIPPDYPEDYLNEDGDGYDAGCGVLYIDEIESAKISKSEAEKREYDKIFEILRSKMPELRSRVAFGMPIFNKKRRTKRRLTRRRMTRRRTKRRTKRRGKK